MSTNHAYNGDNWQEVRKLVLDFVENEVYPAEKELSNHATHKLVIEELKLKAKAAGLWALGHPKEIGGQGMPFLEFAQVNEIIGRSEFAQKALGSYTQQDSIMLDRFATDSQREKYLTPLVNGDIYPSFGMTEPGISSSDPTQLGTTAELKDGYWHINGRKWFTTGAADATFTTIMCRTEPDAAPHSAFSMILVPTDSEGYNIIRDTPILGIEDGHYEVEYDNIRVPEENLLGERGTGFSIAQTRLGPGRIFHCMRWLGQAQRAFDLMCHRLHTRSAFGESLARKQLMQLHVFNCLTEIQACRELTLSAAKKIDAGELARIEIGIVKVAGANMLNHVLDSAIQVFGAEGLTDDTPLGNMYRHARGARIYDGPDEVHIQSVAKQVLKQYRDDKSMQWDFSQ